MKEADSGYRGRHTRIDWAAFGQSWREVLLKLKARGMNCPKLAIGDGALGFWAAADEILS